MRWTFRRAEVPRVIPSRLDRDPEYAKWKHLEPDIEHLVLVTETFIVYVDCALDVDWSLRDGEEGESDTDLTPEEVAAAEEDEKGFAVVLNRVAMLETSPCDELPRRMKLHFKRLLGEGIARGLQGDFEGAQFILGAAGDYIAARSEETSRFWYLSGSTATAFIFIAIGCLGWCVRGWLQEQVGLFAFWEGLAACAGAIGALLSVIGRTGNQHFDCSAGKRLHYLEAASRIVAGLISGALVGLAVHAQVFLTALTHGGNLPSIMILAALASGVSERLATSIIVSNRVQL